MIVVAGGSSSRFGRDKLLETINGIPLIAHTASRCISSVDTTVLVTRSDLIEPFQKLDLKIEIVVGGATRTLSEKAGLDAVGGDVDLIGIHDGARPLINASLIQELFEVAKRSGGAVPVLAPEHMLIDRDLLRPVSNCVVVQTPQVFRGRELLAAYARSVVEGYEARDTVEIVSRFSELPIMSVAGDPGNIKVTYPEDLEAARSALLMP